MKILIDIGGSGVKIKRSVDGVLCPDTRSSKPNSLEEFYSWIWEVAQNGDTSAKPDVEGIAVSICGEYDYINHEVISCWHYPFLKGKLRDALEEQFKCRNVHIFNDGDAHALALKSVYIQKGVSSASAINLSLGTAVGFGILDWRGDLLHTCQGHNWEVGHWQCDTRARHKEQYWALGSQGLKSLEDEYGNPNAYIYYGQRLCHFLGRDLVPIFHPKIIGLSGGIVAAHFQDIEEGIRREAKVQGYCAQGAPLSGVDIYLSQEKDSVMRGLADLLDHDKTGLSGGAVGRVVATVKSTGKQVCALLRKLSISDTNSSSLPSDKDGCAQWEENIPENRTCSLLAAHAGCMVCAENGGNDPLVANRPSCLGVWETFLLLKNIDGSFSLKSLANDKYVSARPLPDGHLIAEASKVDEWEKFDLQKVPSKDATFTLKSRCTQKYVSVDENAGNVLIADRDVADTWEEFHIVCR